MYNETELLKKVASDDEEAFRELFIFYRPRLFAITFRIVGNIELANDICQDVFLRVWLKRNTLSEVENFQSWLYTITRNLVFDALKQPAIVVDGSSRSIYGDLSDSSYDPARILQNKEVQKILVEAIGLLSERQRQTYQLIKVEEMSRSEAAATMNISTETVKWNLEQAMRRIRAYCLTKLDFIHSLALIGFLF